MVPVWSSAEPRAMWEEGAPVSAMAWMAVWACWAVSAQSETVGGMASGRVAQEAEGMPSGEKAAASDSGAAMMQEMVPGYFWRAASRQGGISVTPARIIFWKFPGREKSVRRAVEREV